VNDLRHIGRVRQVGSAPAGVVVGLLALVLGVAPAFAARPDHTTRADALESDVRQIASTAERIERNVAPGRGFITPDQAARRYQDYVYFHLIGRHEQAAEGFFALVTTGALTDAGLHWDAEWYLAESLYKMGNLRTAEAYFKVILEDARHPFRDDAVRRLLEIYVDVDDEAAFQLLYENEILSGRVRGSDLITYAVGKAFFRKGDRVQAKSSLGDLTPQSPYYRKARYILGAIMVVEGNLETAAQIYRSIVELSVETTDDRRVLDLSLLALGRIYMELGLYQEAAGFYAKIGGDSEFLTDKLYEEIWTLIKQKEEIRGIRVRSGADLPPEEVALLQRREQELVQQALRGVDLFLLRYSEHEYGARLRLLQGHLHIQAVEYQKALNAYQSLINDYAPVRERFRELASSDDKPKEYFRQILEQGDKFRGARDQLPPFAMSLVLADRELGRALTIYRDLERQRQMLSTSEGIIVELRQALENATGIGGFDTLRYDAQLARSLVVQRQFELLDLEDAILEDALSGDARRQVAAQRGALASAQSTALEAVAKGDHAGARGQVASLRSARTSARGAVRDPDAARLLERLDRMHTALVGADDNLAGSESRLGRLEATELQRIRERFEREVTSVEQQRADLASTLTEAERVSVELTRSGFGRLEDFFADSVMRADVGLIDVYWAQKVEVTDEKKRVIQERNELRSRILNRFEQIEQKLRL
jgi:tetratricopeptide (TPR) repeat protein